MGSTGEGKTTFISNIIKKLSSKFSIGVIEGDIAGKIDAEKISTLGIPVVQLNTDGACHIEAMSIKTINPEFDLDNIDLLIIENIGNLVCPAEFNLGEDLKVAILSVPEGDDKVLKYPLMFNTAHSLIINKYDMIKYFDFNYDTLYSKVKEMNPNMDIFPASSLTGQGMDEIAIYLEGKIRNKINR